VRRGASWTADHHLQLTVAAVVGSVLVVLAAELSWLVGRPDGGCPVERPAGIQRSGVVAVVGKARTPAMASVAGPRPACGLHPSGPSSGVQRVQPSSVRPSGVQRVQRPPVRCPAVWCPAVWCPPVWCPPVRWSAGCCPPRPSGRVRLIPPRRWRCGPGRCGWQPAPQERVEVPVGVTPWSGSVDGRAGPDAARLPGSRVGQWGRWRTRAGLGAGGGRASPAGGPGGAGRRAERCR
jgi:hypothetical protein